MMKSFLEFDDPGAPDDHPVKGVTVGDIRAWHDEQELHSAHYDRILSTWAECRKLLSEERARTDRIRALMNAQQYENDVVSVGQIRRALSLTHLSPQGLRVSEEAFGDALEELASTARVAVSHVGYANYAEREREAQSWIRKKHEELLALALTRPAVPQAAPETQGCNHWPGQKRCAVCGMGSSSLTSNQRSPHRE